MDLSHSAIAVTGASGSLGRYIVRALLGRGAHVIAVVRNPDKAPAFKMHNIEVRQANLDNRSDLYRAFAGADAVISNAALLAFGSETLQNLLRVNQEGVENTFLAMADVGIKRAVHISSASVYRAKRPHHYTEEDPLKEPNEKTNRFSHYSLSKACGEREAQRLCAEHDIQLSILRPTGIYGAFDQHGFTNTFWRLMALPIAPYPTHMFIPNVYAGDVAEAACLVLEKDLAIGRLYNLASALGERSYWDHYRAYKKIGGKVPKLLVPLPIPIRYEYNIDRAERELGWRNRSLEDGFRDLLEFEQSWA